MNASDIPTLPGWLWLLISYLASWSSFGLQWLGAAVADPDFVRADGRRIFARLAWCALIGLLFSVLPVGAIFSLAISAACGVVLPFWFRISCWTLAAAGVVILLVSPWIGYCLARKSRIAK